MESSETVLLILVELLAALGALLLADRWLHRHLQGVAYLLAGDAEIALWIYALILFPGVVLHELSHALIAILLHVRISGFSVFPRHVGRNIQLGFVPVQETDFLRASLIGAAPLLIGSAVVVGIGAHVFGTPEVLTALYSGQWGVAFGGLLAALEIPDVWIWAYLLFAVGNTMLPSRADVHAWPFLGGVLAVLVVLILLAGGGNALLAWIIPPLTMALRWIVLLSVSAFLVDLPFFLLIYLAEKALERLKGQKIVYRS